MGPRLEKYGWLGVFTSSLHVLSVGFFPVIGRMVPPGLVVCGWETKRLYEAGRTWCQNWERTKELIQKATKQYETGKLCHIGA